MKFSDDFGLVLPILRRFLSLLVLEKMQFLWNMLYVNNAVVMEIMQWQDWE